MAEPDVVVIGAGVVGVSTAIAARARGFSVLLVDREGPAAGASAGNAGAFAFSDILPLASPRILRKAPGWMIDPLGPLTVPPAHALRIAPWMFHFWRACSPARVKRSTVAQAALMDLSKAELAPFLAQTGTSPMLRREGNLEVYEGEAQFRASLAGWRVRQEHGIGFEHLDAAGMAAIQPGLAPCFSHGTFTPGWHSVADPKLFTLALADHFHAAGGAIERAEVTALRPVGDGVEVAAPGRTIRAAHAVVAAGAFSHRIARTIGEAVPLETERGYNTTLPADAFDLRTQVTFGGHGFVVTRLSTGIRVGGAVELGGLDRPPNFRRSAAMLKKAQAFLPGLRPDGGVQWMGFRPSLPDSLPAIGRARATPRVIYAFGHGHLGLTQAAGTARLVADLLVGAPPAIDIGAFSAQRFS